ncbi:hypothetical protein JCM10207_005971 [Rhodosporidiobolus poonsookiae]
MLVNNAGWIDSLSASDPHSLPRYSPLPSRPCIARHLPSLHNLDQLATKQAHESRRASVLRDALETTLDLPSDAASPPAEDTKRRSSFFDALSFGGGASKRGSGVGLDLGTQIEPFQVLRAVEKKDIMQLAEIKARQFDLLVTGNPLPLVYAMRLGKSHAEIAIILVGAMSRKVNDTTDDELAMMQPSTKATLRAIRANLKIAITASLSPVSNDTSLLSSFLQVLLMLEGTRFLQSAAQELSLALRSPPTVGKPVSTAQAQVHRFFSRELKERQVASVDEFAANAAGDLVMLGLWGVVMDQLPVGKVEAVPTYYFARDDRIHKAVEERLSLLRSQHLYAKLSPTVRRQLETTLDVLGRRTMNGPQRVELLKKALDRGEKVERSRVGSAG